MAEDFSWKRLNLRSKLYIILLAVFVFYLTVFKHFFPSHTPGAAEESAPPPVAAPDTVSRPQ